MGTGQEIQETAGNHCHMLPSRTLIRAEFSVVVTLHQTECGYQCHIRRVLRHHVPKSHLRRRTIHTTHLARHSRRDPCQLHARPDHMDQTRGGPCGNRPVRGPPPQPPPRSRRGRPAMSHPPSLGHHIHERPLVHTFNFRYAIRPRVPRLWPPVPVIPSSGPKYSSLKPDMIPISTMRPMAVAVPPLEGRRGTADPLQRRHGHQLEASRSHLNAGTASYVCGAEDASGQWRRCGRLTIRGS